MAGVRSRQFRLCDISMFDAGLQWGAPLPMKIDWYAPSGETSRASALPVNRPRVRATLGRLANHVPWWGKVAAKVLLSRLPVGHRMWKQLGLFQHGAMEQPVYASSVFMKHFARVRSYLSGEGFVCLELGPGESLFSAMMARACGASLCYLIDVGRFAVTDLPSYHGMARYMWEMGLSFPELDNARTVMDVIDACHAVYETEGLDSLRKIPAGSVDFVWSHSVLQHVRRDEFVPLMRELHRVLRGGGVSSHVVDLGDCIGGGLNNLRFRDRLWESSFVATSGFYTNRIRYSQMIGLFRDSGFEVDLLHTYRWEHVPIAREKLSPSFHGLPDDDLAVSGFEVILKAM